MGDRERIHGKTRAREIGTTEGIELKCEFRSS